MSIPETTGLRRAVDQQSLEHYEVLAYDKQRRDWVLLGVMDAG